MFLIQQFLPGVLAAALISGFLFCIAGWLQKGPSWGGAVAIGVGYACGHAVVAGWPTMPPHSASQWLAWFALAGAVAGVLDGLLCPEKFLRAFLWILICAGAVRLLVQPGFQHTWTVAQGMLWVTGLAIGAGLLSWSFEIIARRQALALSLPLTLTIIATGTSAALMLSGSMLLGQFASVLSAAAATLLALIVILPRRIPEGRGTIPVAVLLFSSLWISGYFYAELPAASALLLGLAPVLSLSAFVGRLNGWKATLLHAVVTCAIVFAAVFTAWRASPPFPY